MITLLVAPDSPQWTRAGRCRRGRDRALAVGAAVAFKAQYRPSGADFAKAYTAKYNAPPSYESAGGYASGLILQRAIEQAGSTDTAKVAAALNATDITTFYGRTKFSTAANEHGLQVGHAMVLAQWQKDKSGQAGEAGGLAAGCQERQSGVSDPLSIAASSNRRICAPLPATMQAQRVRNVWHSRFHD